MTSERNLRMSMVTCPLNPIIKSKEIYIQLLMGKIIASLTSIMVQAISTQENLESIWWMIIRLMTIL